MEEAGESERDKERKINYTSYGQLENSLYADKFSKELWEGNVLC